MLRPHLSCLPLAASLFTFLLWGSVGPAAAVTTTFTNTSGISILDESIASPYPSTIDVSGVSGLITDINVVITGLTHLAITDIAILLVGPGGEDVALMDSAGTGSVSSVTYTFDDAAADFLPFGSTPPTGTYKPSPYDSSGNISATPAFSLSSPAPAQPYGLFLSAFNGAAANGTWSLFVQDFLDFGSLGSIRSWSLEITTEAAVVPEPTTLSLVGLGLVALVMRHRCQ